MPRVARQERTSFDVPPQQSQAFDLGTLKEGGPDILVADRDTDLKKLMSDEAFMHEMIKIRFLDSGDPNATKAVELKVATGGITGPMGAATADYPMGVPGKASRGGKVTQMVFARGVVYEVPRYVFEVAAHAKTSTLSQTSDPRAPMELVQTLKNSFQYGFECVYDPNPKGQAWREMVLRDPA